MSPRWVSSGSTTGRALVDDYDGTPSYRSLFATMAVGFGVPILSALYGPTWLLLAELAPLLTIVAALWVTGWVVGRQMRGDYRAAGFGLNPDAITVDRPFAVTAMPGREDDLFLDGLAWSIAGCPLPASAFPERRWCMAGHPANVPAGGLLLPVLDLFGKRRWRCRFGHLGTETEAPVPFAPGEHGRPARQVEVIRGGELAAELADALAGELPAEVQPAGAEVCAGCESRPATLTVRPAGGDPVRVCAGCAPADVVPAVEVAS